MKGKGNKKKDENSFQNALIKKALGYDTKEIVEEYVGGEEGEIKLSKKKITTKNVPPDISALKMLLDKEEKPLSELSDEELEAEKNRLIKILSEN
ncbi:MAG: hypothetical protein IJR66_05630 [Clostridia bacterium]|nr:hypothetical protein [Clostridia bacterium]